MLRLNPLESVLLNISAPLEKLLPPVSVLERDSGRTKSDARGTLSDRILLFDSDRVALLSEFRGVPESADCLTGPVSLIGGAIEGEVGAESDALVADNLAMIWSQPTKHTTAIRTSIPRAMYSSLAIRSPKNLA